MIVVDTNIISYLLLPTPMTDAAEALYLADPEWAAPVLWRSEFRDVLALYLRKGLLTLDEALSVQERAADRAARAPFFLAAKLQLRGLFREAPASRDPRCGLEREDGVRYRAPFPEASGQLLAFREAGASLPGGSHTMETGMEIDFGPYRLIQLLGHRYDGVNAVAFSPDGTWLASGASDSLIRGWDPMSGAELRVLEGHQGGVTSLAIGPDGQWLASGAHDFTVRLCPGNEAPASLPKSWKLQLPEVRSIAAVDGWPDARVVDGISPRAAGSRLP